MNTTMHFPFLQVGVSAHVDSEVNLLCRVLSNHLFEQMA